MCAEPTRRRELNPLLRLGGRALLIPSLLCATQASATTPAEAYAAASIAQVNAMTYAPRPVPEYLAALQPDIPLIDGLDQQIRERAAARERQQIEASVATLMQALTRNNPSLTVQAAPIPPNEEAEGLTVWVPSINGYRVTVDPTNIPATSQLQITAHEYAHYSQRIGDGAFNFGIDYRSSGTALGDQWSASEFTSYFLPLIASPQLLNAAAAESPEAFKDMVARINLGKEFVGELYTALNKLVPEAQAWLSPTARDGLIAGAAQNVGTTDRKTVAVVDNNGTMVRISDTSGEGGRPSTSLLVFPAGSASGTELFFEVHFDLTTPTGRASAFDYMTGKMNAAAAALQELNPNQQKFQDFFNGVKTLQDQLTVAVAAGATGSAFPVTCDIQCQANRASNFTPYEGIVTSISNTANQGVAAATGGPQFPTSFLAGTLALHAGESRALNGGFIAMQTDGNLVIYDNASRPLWSTNTWGRACSYQSCVAVYQAEGNLVLYQNGQWYWAAQVIQPNSILSLSTRAPYVKITSNGALFWTSDSAATVDAGGLKLSGGQVLRTSSVQLAMQNDGNFVVYDLAWTPLWASNTAGRYCPGNSCIAIFQGDGNLVLYQDGYPYWASATIGTGNHFTFSPQYPYMTVTDSYGNWLWASW